MWSHETHRDTRASAPRIWQLWTDVVHWPRWNTGVQSAWLNGPFATGSTFGMQLPPGDEPPLTSTLHDAQPGTAFVDETWLGGTCVRVTHRLQPLPDGACGGSSRIVYRTEVTGSDAANIGAAVSADFDQVLAALARLAESAPHP